MNSHRIQAYAEFFQLIKGGDPNQVIEFVLKVLLSFISYRSNTLSLTNQIIQLFSTLCHNVHTQKVLLSLEASHRLITQHQTMSFDSLYQPHAGRFLSSFYAAMTELLLVRAPPGDLEQFCMPLVERLQQFHQNQPINDNALCIYLREITGILRSCTKSHQYIIVYDLMYLLLIQIILLAILLYLM